MKRRKMLRGETCYRGEIHLKEEKQFRGERYLKEEKPYETVKTL